MKILIIGHINSGKSTVSNYLKSKGFKIYSLGDGVKQFIVDMYAILHQLDSNIQPINLNDLYDRDKKEIYRKHMQLISTELLRSFFGDDIWVNYLKRKLIKPRKTSVDLLETLKNNSPSPTRSPGLNDEYIVIDDIRFKNEYELLKDDETISIKITRPTEIKTNHEEIDLIETDYVVNNNQNLDELFKQINKIIECY